MSKASECGLLTKKALGEFFGTSKASELDELIGEFNSNLDELLKRAQAEGLTPNQALALANKEATYKIKQKARAKIKTKERVEATKLHMEQFKDDPKLGLETLLTNMEGKKYSSDSASIYGKREAIQNLSLGMLTQRVSALEGGLQKMQKGEYDLDVKRILAGEVDQAEMGRMDPFVLEYAKAARALQDHLHELKVDAGMEVGYLKNRISGQRHNAQGMVRMGQEKWTETAREAFDWDRMDVKPEDQDKFLSDMWSKVTEKDGQSFFRVGNDMTEVIVESSRKKLERSRAIHFKNAEASHNYTLKVNNERNLLQALLMEVERDSGKIAAAQKLGPNYTAHWTKLSEDIDTSSGMNSLDAKWESAVFGSKGAGTSPQAKVVSTLNKIADITKLGNALLSTFTDLAFGAGVISSSTGKNYLQSVVGTVENILQSVPNRRQAAIYMHTNLVDTLDSTFTGRVNEDGPMTNWLDGMHNMYMKATGLPAQSQLFRSSFAIQFGGDLYDMRGLKLEDMDKTSLSRMQKYGIDSKAWDILRTEALDELPDGRKVINSKKILDLDPELFAGSTKSEKRIKRNEIASNMNALLVELSEVASPTPNSSTMAWRDTTNPDSVAGMLARAMGKYKSFILSMPKTLMAIKGDDGFNPKSVTNLSAALFTAMALKVSIDHLKAEINGREPEDYTDPAVWTKALLTSGGGGIYADFIAQDFGSNPFASAAETLMGPGIDTAQDIYSLASGTVQYAGNRAVGNKKAAKTQKKRSLRAAESLTPSIFFTKNNLVKGLYTDLHKIMNTGARR